MHGLCFEQGQIQNYLIHELPVPYALTDGNGVILWSNAAFHKIAGDSKGKHLTQIFTGLNKHLLPSDVNHTISHINYVKKRRRYREEIFLQGRAYQDFGGKFHG